MNQLTTAIILAAGKGTRLRPLTEKKPKCLVPLLGEPILYQQLRTLRSTGVNNIHIVGGYLANQLDIKDTILHYNSNYDTTNMVSTLFCANSALDGSSDVVIAYGDIVYEQSVLQSLLDSDAPITLAVDLSWLDYWKERMDDPLNDAETLKLSDSNKIIEIGKKPSSYDDIDAQYIGLIKIRKDYVEHISEEWRNMDRSALYDGQNYYNMYMTSFLQYLIDQGYDVRASFAGIAGLKLTHYSI